MESEYITGPLALMIPSPSLAHSPLPWGPCADCHLNFSLEVLAGLISAPTSVN